MNTIFRNRQSISRIAFFPALLILLIGLLLSIGIKSHAQTAENLNLNKIVQPPYNCYGRLADGCPNAEKLGWKVGIQFYSFHKYTFFEGIDLTRALGLHLSLIHI